VFTGCSPLAYLSNLIGSEGALAATVGSLAFCNGNTFALALPDDCTLEFSDTA
jgi:hypothetical protein